MKMLKKFQLDTFESLEKSLEEQILYSEINLKEACAIAYEKGFQEGLLYQTREKILEHNALHYEKALDVIVLTYEKITALFEMEKEYCQNLKKEVGKMTQECLQSLFPLVKKELGEKNIHGLIEKAFDSVIGEEPIQICASLEDKESLLELLHDKRLLISFEDQLPSGDCHIKWKGGGGFWQQQDTYEKICTFLRSFK